MPEERRSSPFCCSGCEAVHGLLDQEGLLRFYDLGGGRDGAVGPVPRTVVAEWLPELEARGRDASGGVRLHLDVQGIRCAACVWLLQEVWRRLPGARSIRIDPSLGQVTLAYEQAQDTARVFLERSSRLGYPMAPASRVAQQDTGLLVRLGICVAIAMNAMILAVSSYFGLDDGPLVPLFRNVLAGLATVSVVVGGPVFFRAAWSGLRAGMVHMDLPISLGLLLAYGGSLWLHAHGADAYFDTVAIFIAFMLGGRFLQQRTLRRNRDQVLADDGAEHMRARRLLADRIEVVPIATIRAGDELLLAPGDLLPVRATVAGSEASFSLDWISGESAPRTFAPGEEVPAGAFFGGRSAVRMRAVSDYLGSGLAELLRRPPDERAAGAGKVRFWHLLAKHYSLGVLIAAAIGALVWAFLDPSRSLPVAISVLVITCPCAMGIATPLAFHLALALLRRRGVFVRSSALLDQTRFLRKVVFDKTGTLTFGGVRALTVTAPIAADQAMLATMVASSNHPVSQAVLATMDAPRFRAEVVVAEVPGQGLEAEVDGQVWRLGSRRFCGLPAVAADDGPECAFACNGVERGRWRLQEDFRSGAAAEIADLRRRGLQVHILSGDKPERVARAAAALGVDPALATGGMSPEGKAGFVRQLDRADTLMLGDGINDAPAFAAAFCAGTPAMDRPVLPARADFFFRGAQAGAVSAVLDIGALQQRVVRVNLTLALLYNGSTLVACLLDLMTPGLTAVLMPISSAALVLHTSIRFARARRRLP
ncbi:MAG: HAD-IC family P-type ATPase [Planctomycetes bacterium]|nr:HAD-IC family P-type ATPase [Planctomycetota bacterium]